MNLFSCGNMQSCFSRPLLSGRILIWGIGPFGGRKLNSILMIKQTFMNQNVRKTSLPHLYYKNLPTPLTEHYLTILKLNTLYKHFACVISFLFERTRRPQAVASFHSLPHTILPTVPGRGVSACPFTFPIWVRSTSLGTLRPVSPRWEMAVHLT